MSTPPSQQPDALAPELLTEDDLRQVSGGVALVVGRVAQAAIGGSLATGKLAGGIGPFTCNACVQGFPRDLLKNAITNPAIKVSLGGF
jgi:hypothetical protein